MKRWLPGICLCVAALAHGETWQFALIGDVPYSARERYELPRMLDAIADTHAALIAHIGDIKHGQARCDDKVFADRQQVFDASRAPFVFVPGDNEWTDCNRISNGAYDPLERLAALRSLFWQRPDSLGRKTIPLERQPGAYPEHSRFRLGPVLFVTLNLPGSDNNYGWLDDASAEFLTRNPIMLKLADGQFRSRPARQDGGNRPAVPGQSRFPGTSPRACRTAASVNFWKPCAGKRWPFPVRWSRFMATPTSAASINRCATATASESPTSPASKPSAIR